ncbi:MAG: hypothetical protein ACR65R_15940 [Methylomicrobium sp.]
MDQTPVNRGVDSHLTKTGRYSTPGVMAFLLLKSRRRARDY